jgi:hypothetical protein
MLKIKKVPLRLLLTGVLFIFTLSLTNLQPAVPAQADAAPALEETNEIGSVLSPYKFKKTWVRMVDEQVRLKLETIPGGEILQSQVSVNADFHMYNTSMLTETMQAVFPLTDLKCPWLAGPGSWTIREHVMAEDSFVVSVDGQAASTQEITTTTVISSGVPGLMLDCKTKWSGFEITFPPRKDVRIRVGYMMSPGVELAYPWDSFTYILKTGEAWYGPIGKVDISMQLPYPVQRGDFLHLPEGHRISGDTVRWHWENLEPAQNFKVVALSPQAREELDAVTKRIRASSADARAWVDLAKVYERLAWRYDYLATCGSTIEWYAFPEVQNWRFAHQAVDAYQRAIRLRPEAPEIRLDLALLLSSMSLSANNGRIQPDFPSVKLALQEFARAGGSDSDSNAGYLKKSFQECLSDPRESSPPCACGY